MTKATSAAVGRLEDGSLRIGTWNLDGRWSDAHLQFLTAADCDVWLLTEVSPGLELPGFHRQLTRALMQRGQHWAGVLSRSPLQALGDPHLASAAAMVDGITYCSSILPWKGLGQDADWPGHKHAEWTERAVDTLLGRVLKRGMVWGGDWNHGLFGPEVGGSKEGRRHIHRALSRLEMNVPTAHLPHQLPGLLSIDHIAVPPDWIVLASEHRPAGTLSKNHDAYVVEARIPPAPEAR